MFRPLSLLAAVLFTAAAHAATYAWNPAVAEGDWSNPANWLVDGAAPAAAPGTSDSVDFAGVTAAVTLSGNTTVFRLTGLSGGADVTFRTATPGTAVGLSAKNFPGTVDATGTFTFDGVNLFPCYENNNNSYWGLNTANVTFGADCTLVAKNGGSINFGGLTVDNTVHFAAKDGGTILVRRWNTVRGIDIELDNGTLDGIAYGNGFTVAGDASITFKGAAPRALFRTAAPAVSGTATLRFVLPASPYAEGPVANKSAIDFAPSGTVRIEIDESSPAFSSGAKQTYVLFGWDNSAANGVKQSNIVYPALRTSEEVFGTSWMAGASTSGYPQYVGVLIDGAYDPSAAALDATFGTPYPENGAMVFPGSIANLGSGAASATVTLEYGETDALGSSAALGTVAEAGDFAFSFAGFGEGTYRYRLVVANDWGASVSSDIGVCSLVCGTELASALTLGSDNGIGAATGSFAVFGSGATTLTLWLSRDRSSWTPAATASYAANPVGGAWSIPFTFPADGAWYGKVSSANEYGGQSWNDETGVADIVVRDALSYAWRADVAEGDWTNAANWICSGVGIGYPTAASAASFPSGATNAVTLAGDMAVASLSPLPADSSLTLRGNGATLLASSIDARGANATLTLDGVSLADTANIWNLAWTLAPGSGSRIALRRGAQLGAKVFSPGPGVTLDLSGGSSLFLREPGQGAQNPAALVVDDSAFEVPDKVFAFSSITFRGAAPAVKVCGLAAAAAPTRLVYELPATPYAAAPLRQSTMLGNSKRNLAPGAGNLAIAIPRDCPARAARTRGPYPLVDWAWDAAYGMNADAFALDASLGRLYEGESLDFAWMDGADAGSVGPHRLSITLSSGNTVILVR